MSGPFTITAATAAVRLDAQGRAATAFTVSNVSGKARRGRARLVPGKPEQAGWLSVAGEPERDFKLGGTEQVAVNLAVPPGTAAGSYTFGLDVISVENPDEDWSQGPKVAFEVAAPKPKKPFPWWIPVAAAALLAVGGVLYWLLGRGGAAVLQVCQQSADCATGLSCYIEPGSGKGLCVGADGFSCASNQECGLLLTCQGVATNQNGVCRGEAGAACKAATDCLTGLLCTKNVCGQKLGVWPPLKLPLASEINAGKVAAWSKLIAKKSK